MATWSLGAIANGRYAVSRVALKDGARSTVALRTDALRAPGGVSEANLPFNQFLATRFAWSPGVAIVQGVWKAVPAGGFDPSSGFGMASSPTETRAYFSTATGELLHQEDATRPAELGSFVVGNAPVVSESMNGRATGVYRDLISQVVLPLSLPRTDKLFGGPLVRFYSDTKRSRWKRDASGAVVGGYGDLQAVRWADGRRAWTVNTETVARRAGLPHRRSAVEVPLTDDGAAVVRVVDPKGRGLRPVALSTAGRLYGVGSRVRGATGVRASLAGKRVLVSLDGSRRVGRRTLSCRGTWLTDVRGSRGRTLRIPRTAALIGWDGTRAVWSTWSAGRTRARIVIQPNAGRLRLGPRALPRCG
ncbi:hypothetical protein SK069_16105 [Patulibacter brassicae]|uniref:Uncharacterized protein n=1 Tax=Patulibacter brassicae TaxID=1705717 RepID=A0ABU4VQH3_9ACTN|nr:hypothetical protein [Patulibacter brassicae]MDX8153123.1 hypothetical protein [Patulibacter brassicae]